MDSVTQITDQNNLVKYIQHTDLFKALDAADIPTVEAALEWVHLSLGDTLFQNGEAGSCMYVVVSGQLGASITQSNGIPKVLNDLTPGTAVGELSLFTGQIKTKAIYALEDTELVKLSKRRFDRLVDERPQIMARFSRFMLPRLRKLQLAEAFSDLFGELAEAALEYLEPELEWQHYFNGDVIMRQGDRDDSLYIVISGKLNVVVQQPDGSRRTVAEIGRGESVGELALLTGEKRSATVYAVRDTVVVRLLKQSFDRLIDRYPRVMLQITRLIVYRLRESNEKPLFTPSVSTIAIVPTTPNPLLTDFIGRLATSFNAFGSTLYLDADRFDHYVNQDGAAQTPRDDSNSLALETWLNEQETVYQYIIYQADPDWSAWTQRCLRNADLILILGWAQDSPRLSKAERQLQQMVAPAPKELVLLHPSNTDRPRGTRRWLDRRRVQAHHHIRLYSIEDVQRFTRRLTGNAVGLALSGGGARAFAHIGAIRAIQEAGLPVDIVGGTSLGSIVAAAYALDWDYDQMVRAAKTFFSPRQIFDYTFPVVAFSNSRKMSRVLAEEFGDIQLEDLWLPYFAVSTNLTRAKEVIHHRGPLWHSLRASCSLPVIFAPVVERGDLLVDGAIMNNLPIDVMHEFCKGGPVIAVDVSAQTDLTADYRFSVNISGWKVLWSKVNPFATEIKAPFILDTLRRSTQLNSVHKTEKNRELSDIFINPQVSHFSLTDFDDYEAIIEAGYRAAREAIDIWLAQQTALWNEKYGQTL